MVTFILLVALCLFIHSCAYLIRGGNPLLFFWYKPPAQGDSHIPGGRFIGCGVSAFAYAAFIIYTGLSPLYALIYPVGWFLVITSGWGRNFTLRTTWEHIWFYGRMFVWSIPLFTALACVKNLSWDSAILGVAFSAVFAFLTVLAYHVVDAIDIKYPDDKHINWREAITGPVLGGLAMLIPYAA